MSRHRPAGSTVVRVVPFALRALRFLRVLTARHDSLRYYVHTMRSGTLYGATRRDLRRALEYHDWP